MEHVGEIDRLVAHWLPKRESMTTAALRTAISHELEMLEYTPSQVETITPQILDRLTTK